jgi:glutamine amidotransferase
MMCRLFAFRSDDQCDISEYLEAFADACKKSPEYQGHGWGIYYITQKGPHLYRALNPIWEDDFSFLEQSRYGLVHARSAFRDEGIHLANNMPFLSSKYQFIFNGELHGVKIRSDGNTGAMKLFRLYQRLLQDDVISGLDRTMKVVNKKTDYIRAANIILGDGNRFYVYSDFNEDSNYFTLHTSTVENSLLISSEAFTIPSKWSDIRTKEVMVF